MPHIIAKIYSGRPDAKKQVLAEAIAEQVVAVLKCKSTSVSVAIEDVDPDDWAETVYRPDVLEKQDQIYRAPGYNPFETKDK
jgi:4-oxalocrotonate tautomerase